MEFISEPLEKKQHVLIVDKESTQLTQTLQTELKKYSSEVYITPQIPLTIDRFDYVFFINEKNALRKVGNNLKQKIIFIFLNRKTAADSTAKIISKQNLNAKVIHLSSGEVDADDLEKILWFSFSKSEEKFLSIESFKKFAVKEIKSKPWNWKKFFTRKRIIVLALSVFILAHLAMIPFLALSSYFYYKSAILLKGNDVKKSERLLSYADASFNLSKSLYQPVRPSYSFFSLAIYPDNFLDINEKTKSLLHNSLTMYENADQIVQLIIRKNKTVEDKKLLEIRMDKMKKDLNNLEDDLTVLIQKLPSSPEKVDKLKTQLEETASIVEKGKRIFPHLDNLLAKNSQKKYLLLFANNMELRPGGGFLGSFGILTMNDLTLDSIQIYDVYDADGQLTSHIDPPDPIRKYLHQPHWFLRDSAFSSDFYENYNQAKFFLDRELKLSGFSGGILLTTSAIQNVLAAYENIYLPDFNEYVNKDNFYIKAQLHSEKDFFPGSIQKKNFLGDLAKQILINLDNVSAPILVQQLEKSLDEKQMVMIVDDPTIQRVIDSLYWAGKTISPSCTEENATCVLDYAFPVDANLGVNKANFFVRRNITQKIKFEESGTIRNSFIMKIQNDSASEVFPGGTYKNYFQLFLPLDSEVRSVTKDGTSVDNIDQRESEFKIIGFYFELAPQKTAEIQVDYKLSEKVPKGSSTYQLVWQKQIGSQNSDLNLEISLPENISLVRQNFSPLVKDNRIFYNTSLNADKIFLLELENK